jgi:hypothetical protein
MKRPVVLVIAIFSMMALVIPAGARSSSFPEVIPLPDGITPEGIATGNGTEFFTGSLSAGVIYKGDLRTGEGSFINEAGDFAGPRSALGMKHDSRSDALWVAGGPTGEAYLYDSDTGETIGVIELSVDPSFVNDVVVTRSAAYFTDSFRPVIYKVPLNPQGLPTGMVETLPLGDEFIFVPANFNGNGIDATADGSTLVLVNSATGDLYTVDPDSGEASPIDLGGDTVASGDGILLHGSTLYVVQNFLNQIAVVELSPDLSSGVVEDAPISSAEFKIPTTIAGFGNYIYAVNARFDIVIPGEPAPDVEFQVVQVER